MSNFMKENMLKLQISIINTAYQIRIMCKFFTLKNAVSLEKGYILEKKKKH